MVTKSHSDPFSLPRVNDFCERKFHANGHFWCERTIFGLANGTFGVIDLFLGDDANGDLWGIGAIDRASLKNSCGSSLEHSRMNWQIRIENGPPHFSLKNFVKNTFSTKTKSAFRRCYPQRLFRLFLVEQTSSTSRSDFRARCSVSLDGRRGLLRRDAIIPGKIFFPSKFEKSVNEFILCSFWQSDNGNPFKRSKNPNHHQIHSLYTIRKPMV